MSGSQSKKMITIPFGEKLSYGFGDLASCLYWSTFMNYMLYFYTDIFGITAGAVGTMLLISRCFDGFNDPFMGIVADRTNTRWGKFRPYFVWMCIPLALFGWLTFTTPEMSAGGRLAWAYCTYIPLMIFYTAINIPYTALLGVISPNPVDRTTVSSIKFMFAFGAGILTSAFLMPMTLKLGKVDPAMKDTNPEAYLNAQQHGWSLAFAIIGVLVVLFWLITFFGTKERVKPPVDQKTNIKQDLKDLIRNKPWIILLLTTMSYVLFTAIRSTVAAHYFKYFVGEQELWLPITGTKLYIFEDLISYYNTVGQAASVLGVFLLPFIVKFLGQKTSFVVLMGISVVSTAFFYFLSPEAVIPMMLLQIVGSIGGGSVTALLWVMYADTADYSQWKNGRRATGLVFSASTMSQKGGWAMAAFFVGWMLQLFGFVANKVQNAEVIGSLRDMMSIIPAAVGILSIVIILFYPISGKLLKTMEEDLAERKAKEDAELGGAEA
jgi:GPH family glycoside/pentoside/hexuronide:cation symporter